MEMMDAAAEKAIRQIDDFHYVDGLLEAGYGNIGRYGISFFRKNCRVRYKDEQGASLRDAPNTE